MGPVSEDLRNVEDLQMNLGVLLPVLHKLVSNLFWSRHARVWNNTAAERVWKVKIQNTARKVGAIIEEKLKVRAVCGLVHLHDECIILCLGGIEPKGVHAALVGHSNKLSPAAM